MIGCNALRTTQWSLTSPDNVDDKSLSLPCCRCCSVSGWVAIGCDCEQLRGCIAYSLHFTHPPSQLEPNYSFRRRRARHFHFQNEAGNGKGDCVHDLLFLVLAMQDCMIVEYSSRYLGVVPS